jgi:hypothetical protein
MKWAICSFQPYKSPGINGIMPIMLQQGFELLVGKFLVLLRACLALGYPDELEAYQGGVYT